MATAKIPARMGQKWTDDEVLKLLTSIQEKKPINVIATEHQRTTGAINAARRKIAAEYWFNEHRPIEEIIELTGLTREAIEDTIKRRTAIAADETIKRRTAIAADETKGAPIVAKKKTAFKDTLTGFEQVVSLLEDIQRKLDFLIEKVQ